MKKLIEKQTKNTSTEISIDLLKNCPQHIPELAEIWHDVLGKIWVPDIPTSYVEQRLKDHLNSNTLPLTIVALDKNKAVGMCSLRINDGIRPDLKPWLASLVVSKAYQKQGIGTKLINAVKQKASTLDFEKLHLFTLDPTIPNWYERLGWEKIGTDTFKGRNVTVMEFDLNQIKIDGK